MGSGETPPICSGSHGPWKPQRCPPSQELAQVSSKPHGCLSLPQKGHCLLLGAFHIDQFCKPFSENLKGWKWHLPPYQPTGESTIFKRRAFKKKKKVFFNDRVCVFVCGRAWPSMIVEVKGSLSGIKLRVQQASVIAQPSCLPEKGDVDG